MENLFFLQEEEDQEVNYALFLVSSNEQKIQESFGMSRKNRNPGFATEKQVQWLSRILRETSVTVDDPALEYLRSLTDREIRNLTDKALVARSVHTGEPLPRWVRMTPELEAYRELRQRTSPRPRRKVRFEPS